MKRFILLLSLLALVACRPNSTTSTSQYSNSASQYSIAPRFSHFAGQSTFVFQPGGTESGITSTTWPSLMASIALSPGVLKWVEVNDSLAAAHVTAGTWDVDGVTFRAFRSKSPLSSLIFDDGAHFTFATIWVTGGLSFLQQGTSAAYTTPVGGPPATIFIQGNGSNIQTAAAPAVPWAHATQDFELTVFLSSSCTLGDTTHNTITVDSAKNIIVLVGGGEGQGGNVLAHALGGLGTAVVGKSAEAIVSAQDIAVVSTNNNALAPNIAYTPATAGNWNPVPTVVNAAFDQLAAPNFVQAAANTGTGTGTTSAVTGNIAKRKSGTVAVGGVATGILSGSGTVTVSMLRDATPIVTLPAITVLATQGFSIPIQFIDALPDAANHTYKVQAVASSGTIATGTGGDQIQAVEQ